MILGFAAVGFMLAGLGYTTREVFREHQLNHHFHTTPKDS